MSDIENCHPYKGMNPSSKQFLRVPIRTTRPKHTIRRNNRSLQNRPRTNRNIYQQSSSRSNQGFGRMEVPHNIHNYEVRRDNDELRNRLH